MKCPLLSMAGIIINYPEDSLNVECFQAECAWWDDGHPGCAILTLAQELATMQQKDELEVKHD